MLNNKATLTDLSSQDSSLKDRVFVFLQGPQSYFYSELASALTRMGAFVIKINLCGGDVFLWKTHNCAADSFKTFNYHGRGCDFTYYISKIFKDYGVDDLVLYSDWRPMHQDAILLARYLKIRVWVFEEGYLRNGFVTLEQNGVNGRSPLPKSPEKIMDIAKNLEPFKPSRVKVESMRQKVMYAIRHHVGNTLLFPCFFHYRTHREHNIFFELIGILPRYLTRNSRKRKSRVSLHKFLKSRAPYFFYPLQLNHDSQVQLYSPYTRQGEAILSVIYSFARYAPENTRLLIKNHPLDNGLIPYRRFIKAVASSLGVKDRVCFIEDGNTVFLAKHAKAVVLINSTVGLSALLEKKNVFCLGYSVYSMPGLAKSAFTDKLHDFWSTEDKVDEKLLDAYCALLCSQSLVEGDFYTQQGVQAAVEGTIKRFINS